jgi:hypothetical protein
MSCCPNDFLLLAQALGGSVEQNEAQLRSATSRGYYAALHTLDDTIPEVDGVERQRNEGSHAFVIRRAKGYGDGPNPGRQEAKKLVHAMKKLKDQRNDADYRLDMDYCARQKDDALARVSAILSYCNDLRRAVEAQSAKTGT